MDLNLTILSLVILLAGLAGGAITFLVLSHDRNQKRFIRRKCDALDQLALLISNAAIIAEHCLHLDAHTELDSHLEILADDLRRLGRIATQLQLMDESRVANAGFKFQSILCRLYNFRIRARSSLSPHLVAKFERVIQLRKVWALGQVSDRYQQTRKEL